MTIIDAIKPMGQLVFSAVGTGTGSLAGMGVTKALHAFLGCSLDAFSYLQGLGVQSNERKEKSDEPANLYQKIDEQGRDVDVSKPTQGLGDKVIERAHRIGMQDLKDLGKSLAVVAIGSAPLFLMDYLGGTYMQEEIAKSFKLPVVASSGVLQAFPAIVLCTVADAVTGVALVKTVQSATSVTLAKLAWVQAQAIASNEEKEKAQDKIGEGLSKRAMRTLTKDVGDILKATAVVVAGTATLYLGTYLGGKSIQVSALEAFRVWSGRK